MEFYIKLKRIEIKTIEDLQLYANGIGVKKKYGFVPELYIKTFMRRPLHCNERIEVGEFVNHIGKGDVIDFKYYKSDNLIVSYISKYYPKFMYDLNERTIKTNLDNDNPNNYMLEDGYSSVDKFILDHGSVFYSIEGVMVINDL